MKVVGTPGGFDPDRWNAPTWSKPLPGAVARASVRFDSNYTAGAWVDLFALDRLARDSKPSYASFEDALEAARQITVAGGDFVGEPGAVGVFDRGLDGGFELRPIEAVGLVHYDDDPRRAPHEIYDPQHGWRADPYGPGDPGYQRRTEGVLALDEHLRAIVDGDVLPVVSRRG